MDNHLVGDCFAASKNSVVDQFNVAETKHAQTQKWHHEQQRYPVHVEEVVNCFLSNFPQVGGKVEILPQKGFSHSRQVDRVYKLQSQDQMLQIVDEALRNSFNRTRVQIVV